MKVLFLDVDGVLNHSSTTFKYNHFPLERYCAFLVGKIQLDTGCEVVLSSSWRHHPESVEHLNKVVVKLFDKTPFVNTPDRIRGDEIKAWLDLHPEVTKYAILDDDSDMRPEQLPNFFKTDFHSGGLTDEIASRVISHLNS